MLVVLSSGGGVCISEEIKFEALYNEEVNFLSNQGVGSIKLPRQGGYKAWVIDEG